MCNWHDNKDRDLYAWPARYITKITKERHWQHHNYVHNCLFRRKTNKVFLISLKNKSKYNCKRIYYNRQPIFSWAYKITVKGVLG
jgi:hypothetical protein